MKRHNLAAFSLYLLSFIQCNITNFFYVARKWAIGRDDQYNSSISVDFSNSVTTSKRIWTLTMHTKDINAPPKDELRYQMNDTRIIMFV